MEMNNKNLINVAGAVGILSCFLPWISAFGMSVSGSQGDGIIVAVLLAVVLIINHYMDTTSSGWPKKLMLTLGALAFLIVGYTFFTIAFKVGAEDPTAAMFVQMQYGLVLSMVSTIAVLVFGSKR